MAQPPRSPEWQYELLGGRLCLDFANTVSGLRGVDERDHLTDYAALVSWGRQAGTFDEQRARALLAQARRRPAEAEAVFRAAIALREAIHRIFRAFAREDDPVQADLDLLSGALGRALSHRRIRRGSACCALGWDEGGEELDAMLWPVVASAAELLVSAEQLPRLRICGLHESGECGWLFLDETRNHTRRWCSMKDCGNRAKARRHYQRART
ncbi:MAG: CGNR zinc finger domain-containing protein [Deltaproteobacteria bacterium]|nr:CGNR zinc finger domain-containing protein [Deltaproteobacteria bacterium]